MKKMNFENWHNFEIGRWTSEINVSDFIKKNYTEYLGDEEFLSPATDATIKLWNEVSDLMEKETQNNGVLDMDTKVV
jgi:formate C-acetyltransferase